jgi:hypothetical protein
MPDKLAKKIPRKSLIYKGFLGFGGAERIILTNGYIPLKVEF